MTHRKTVYMLLFSQAKSTVLKAILKQNKGQTVKKYSNISRDKTCNRTQNHICYLWVISFPCQLKREREANTSTSANYIWTYNVKTFSRAHAYKVSPHNIRQQPGNSFKSASVHPNSGNGFFSIFICCNLLRLSCYWKINFYFTFIYLENHYLLRKQKAAKKIQVWNKAKCWTNARYATPARLQQQVLHLISFNHIDLKKRTTDSKNICGLVCCSLPKNFSGRLKISACLHPQPTTGCPKSLK